MSTKKAHDDESGLSKLDPAGTLARDAAHFRRIVRARAELAAAEEELREAVRVASLRRLLDRHRCLPGHDARPGHQWNFQRSSYHSLRIAFQFDPGECRSRRSDRILSGVSFDSAAARATH